MPEVRISDLPAMTTPAPNSVLIMNDTNANTTKKFQLNSWIGTAHGEFTFEVNNGLTCSAPAALRANIYRICGCFYLLNVYFGGFSLTNNTSAALPILFEFPTALKNIVSGSVHVVHTGRIYDLNSGYINSVISAYADNTGIGLSAANVSGGTPAYNYARVVSIQSGETVRFGEGFYIQIPIFTGAANMFAL